MEKKIKFLLVVPLLLLIAAKTASWDKDAFAKVGAKKTGLPQASFLAATDQAASEIQIPTSWLLATMWNESSFEVDVKNRQGHPYYGLIQCGPACQITVGQTAAKIEKMGYQDQLKKVVVPYFRSIQKRGGRLHRPVDVYLAVLYPAAVGQHSSYVLYKKGSKSYKANKGMDYNKDGTVTVGDVEEILSSRYHTLLQNLDIPTETPAFKQGWEDAIDDLKFTLNEGNQVGTWDELAYNAGYIQAARNVLSQVKGSLSYDDLQKLKK